MFKIIRIIEGIGVAGVLLCLSGYDCPDCNYVAQTIALGVCICVCVVCGLIANRKDGER